MMAMNIKFRVPHVLKSVRYSLAAVNGVFLLTGLMLLFAGIAVLVQYTEYEELITKRFFSNPNFVIATGVIILLGSALGVYGAISQEFYFVVGYVVLLLVVLVFEISIIISCNALGKDAEKEIRATMVHSLNYYSSRIEIAQIWDNLQRGFECCGVAGRFDYSSAEIPISCCHIDYGTVSPFVCETANAYGIGCGSVLGEHLGQLASTLAVCAIVATCIQIVLVAFSGYLAYRTKYEDVELES